MLETEINCGDLTCGECEWVYGEKVGDPYCGWFRWHGHGKKYNTILGKYKSDLKKLKRLPECIEAEKKAEIADAYFNEPPSKEVVDSLCDFFEKE